MVPRQLLTAAIAAGAIGAGVVAAREYFPTPVESPLDDLQTKFKKRLQSIEQFIPLQQANANNFFMSGDVESSYVGINSTDFYKRDSVSCTALQLAVTIPGAAKQVKALLGSGADPLSAIDPPRLVATPLHIWAAAGHADEEILDVLLANGVDINMPDVNGYNALDYAVAGTILVSGTRVDHHVKYEVNEVFPNSSPPGIRTAGLLFKKGARLRQPVPNGIEPTLNVAARYGNIEDIPQLISHGARTEVAACVPAICVAVQNRQYLVTRLLLNLSFSPTITNVKQQNLAHLIAFELTNPSLEQDGITELSKILGLLKLSGVNLDAADCDGNTPLHLIAAAMTAAVSTNNEKIARAQANLENSLRRYQESKKSSFFYTNQQLSLDLSRAGFDLAQEKMLDECARIRSAMFLFINHGASLNIKNMAGQTPLELLPESERNYFVSVATPKPAAPRA